MSTEQSPRSNSPAQIKAGSPDFIFELDRLAHVPSNQGHTSPVIEGGRINVALITKTRGARAQRPHTHPNEQWNYIVRGTLRVKIADQPERLCGPGTLLHFPANVVHSTATTPDEDVVFLAIKDGSHDFFGGKAAARGA